MFDRVYAMSLHQPAYATCAKLSSSCYATQPIYVCTVSTATNSLLFRAASGTCSTTAWRSARTTPRRWLPLRCASPRLTIHESGCPLATLFGGPRRSSSWTNWCTFVCFCLCMCVLLREPSAVAAAARSCPSKPAALLLVAASHSVFPRLLIFVCSHRRVTGEQGGGEEEQPRAAQG